MKKGKVYITGAGPGDERLLSIRALELIKRADVIVYDRLASRQFLSKAKKDCQCIYVGKGPDKHTLKQEEINQVLVKKALEGKDVVRLKGGDPFIFGRGGEEAEYLRENGISFEIIPGISSFYSACAYAGIPITYRNYASSFHVFTGHFQQEQELDYSNIAAMEGTLIFLMGMNNLDKITTGLLREGKNKHTPASIIEWGTTSRQREVVGELWNLQKLAEEKKLRHPAIIIIGNVVSVKEKIEWQRERPLWGRKILLTRTTEASSEIRKKLTELGAEVEELPTIKIGPIEENNKIDVCLDKIQQYSWIFFTSVNGVDYFFQRLWKRKMDIRCLYGIKLFCIGERTKKAVEEKGLFVDRMPQAFHSEQTEKELSQFISNKDFILYPTSDLASDQLCQAVQKLGASCDEVAVYYNKINEDYHLEFLEEIKKGAYDAILFASSSQVENYHKIMKGVTGGAKLCSIGKKTTRTAEELGYLIDATAEISSAEGLKEAVLKLFSK